MRISIKSRVVEQLEEARARCDDLFADLADCQEQLRMERARALSGEAESKRPRLMRPELSVEELLLRLDYQYVDVTRWSEE